MRPSTITGAILAMAILASAVDVEVATAQAQLRPCSSEDSHYLYSSANQTLKRIDTKAASDETGRPYREILNAQITSLRPGESSSHCPAGKVDSTLRLGTIMVGTHEVHYPSSTPIERIAFDSATRALVVTLPATPDRPTVVSLAFSQELLPNNGYIARVLLDGNEVDASETTNSRMRSVSVRILPGSRTVRIEGASHAGEQMATWSAGLLGFLFAFVVVFAMRLRRHLTS